jgi:hypothetical protein
MACKSVEARFAELVHQIKKRQKQYDFSDCNTADELLLPKDLGVMISYLEKRYQK